jgi:hypothetical protein
MARSKKTAHTKSALGEVDAYSIPGFCERHSISLAFFYKARDQMPASFHIGKRHLISKESAARWRKQKEREAASAADNA